MCKSLRLLALFIFGLFLFFPRSSFAYEIDTHSYLTDSALNFYNKYFSDQNIPANFRDFLIDGSRREDDTPRWMNHFYDPVHEQGLTDIALGTWTTSKKWAQTGSEQNKLKYKVPATIASILNAVEEWKISDITTESDFEWRQAIQYYLWGEKEKAMFVLGHILHLVEDASVPDHTRNDSHPGDSPYEIWTKQFTLASPDNYLLDRLKNKPPILKEDLDSFFDALAIYSNNNFYSENSIGIQSGFNLPEPDDFLIMQEKRYALSRDNEGFYKLFVQSKNSSVLVATAEDITVDDSLVMKDYWSRLSTKAVQYSAGVINLFFQEVEKAKNDPTFSKTKPKSAVAQLIESTGDTVGGLFFQIQNSVADIFQKSVSMPIQEMQKMLAVLMTGGNSSDPVFAVPFQELQKNIERLTTDVSNLTEKEINSELQSILDDFQAITSTTTSNAGIKAEGKVLGVTIENASQPTLTPQPTIVYGGGGVFTSTPAPIPEIVPASSTIPEPEPESPTPPASLLQISYSSSSAELLFNWSAMPNVEGTSTVEYELKEITSSSILFYRGLAKEFRMRITEVGREYNFSVQQFVDGVETGTSEKATINVPSFLSEVYFYEKASGTPVGNILEFAYPTYPFIPDLFWETKNSTYKIVFVYLNSEPPAGDEFVNLLNGFEPTDQSNLITFNFKRCYNSRTPGNILIFPDPGGFCGYGGPYTIAISGEEREDNRVKFPIVSPAQDFISSDYVTFAFYAFFDSGPASAFRRVAVDKTHYRFQNNGPTRKSPYPISDLQLSFNTFRSTLELSWPQGADQDSRDETLLYEYNFSTTSSLDVSAWKTTLPWTRTVAVPVESGNIYTVGVRVRDEDGNVSEPFIKEWQYPDDYIPLPYQRVYANDIGMFGSGQKITIPRNANVNGALLRIGAIINYMSFSVTYVDIYTDRDGAPGDLVGSSEIVRKTWVTSGTEVAHMEDSEMIYEFNTPVSLYAGETYWIIPNIGGGNQTTLRVLGSNNNPYPDGEWNGGSSANAYFFLREVE